MINHKKDAIKSANKDKVHSRFAIIILLVLLVCSFLWGCLPKKPKYDVARPLYVKTLTKMNSEIDRLVSVNWDESPDKFYFNQLSSDRDKLIYLYLEKKCQEQSPLVSVYGLSDSDVLDIVAAIWADNPELFWIYDYVINQDFRSDDPDARIINFGIPEGLKEDMEKVNAIADEFINTIPYDASDYEKVKLIFDWIGETTVYEAGERDQDIRSVFLDGKSVCAGFSHSFQLLCQRAGISCASVTGWAEKPDVEEGNEYHEWNLVKIDGKTYWVDSTWGDSFVDEGGTLWPHNYNYLCMSDQDLEGNYRIDKRYRQFGGIEYEYPECPSDDLDYYRIITDDKEVFFDDYDYWNVLDYIQRQFYSGKTSGIEMQFANKDDYEDAVTRLLDNEEIFDLIWETFPYNLDATVDSIEDDGFGYFCFSVTLG